MPRGGKRVGAGRKGGSTDRKLRKISVQEIMDRVGTGPDKMPLPFLLAVMHAPPEEQSGVKMSERIQCAIAAAPYCHARYSSIEIKTESRSTISVQSELAAALRDLAEVARMREIGPVLDGEVLEPGTRPDTLSEPDIMSTAQDQPDIVTAGHFVHDADDGPDILSTHTEGEGEDFDEAEEDGAERPEN